jgi:Ca-activated chloride channel family protein
LDVVKETFSKFVLKRPGDLIGLVTFGGFASSRVPLTLDHTALLHSLKGVDIAREQYNKDGQLLNLEEMRTAIGDALATGCTRLDEAGVKSKIIVLLSDGESNAGLIKPEEAAKAAKTMGIRIYAIGVGTTGCAPFPMRDMFGRTVVGQAEVRLDEELLRSIASTTGGKYFNVTDAKGLEQTMTVINKLEKTAINTELYNKYDEHFTVLLGIGLVLVVLGAVVNAWLGKNIL